jgi:DNA-binding NarL/FixJ family response regulator
MTAVRPVRVIILDDHELVREGIKTVLLDAPDIDVVGEAGTTREALELIGR